MADERDAIAEAMLATQLERNPALPPESWNRGVRNVTTGVLGGLMEIPKQAYGAAQQYTDTGEYNPEPIMGAATTMMTGGMPMAAKGAAGMFGGRLSQGADLRQLMRAEDMATGKSTPQQIRNATGWLQRPDKQWRYEIPDQGARFNEAALNSMHPYERRPLGEVFQHPRAYEAYPELKDMQFGHKDLGKGAIGYYQPPMEQPGILRQQAGLPPKMLPEELVVSTVVDPPRKPAIALHELQHVVQGKEGFAIGGRPSQRAAFGTPAFEIFKELRPKLAPAKLEKMSPEQFTKTVQGNLSSGSYSKDAIDKFINDMRTPGRRDQAAEHFAKTLAYRRLLGESEARLVERRSTMSPEEIKKVFPTLDIPDKNLIVRMSDREPW